MVCQWGGPRGSWDSRSLRKDMSNFHRSFKQTALCECMFYVVLLVADRRVRKRWSWNMLWHKPDAHKTCKKAKQVGEKATFKTMAPFELLLDPVKNDKEKQRCLDNFHFCCKEVLVLAHRLISKFKFATFGIIVCLHEYIIVYHGFWCSSMTWPSLFAWSKFGGPWTVGLMLSWMASSMQRRNSTDTSCSCNGALSTRSSWRAEVVTGSDFAK